MLLLAAGADPNDDCGGDRPETPLHWSASTDDLEVAVALIEGGRRGALWSLWSGLRAALQQLVVLLPVGVGLRWRLGWTSSGTPRRWACSTA